MEYCNWMEQTKFIELFVNGMENLLDMQIYANYDDDTQFNLSDCEARMLSKSIITQPMINVLCLSKFRWFLLQLLF